MAAIPPVCDFGLKAPDFHLKGTDGLIHGLDDLKGPKGTVIAFICNHCPYVQAILDSLIQDARDLAGIGVTTIAICSNDAASHPEDGFEQMAELARRKEFPFAYLHDESQEVARHYGAICTPDFFGYNARLELQYRGRLDASGKAGKPGAKRELVLAMREVALTGEGPREQTPSIGCSIKWKNAA
ncbi:AhpC/TSA family protein [Arboricoccus pini]|uniref:AhpC/TSA family protein n=1 Tax=Arboricoccus pini TaxID=1963835 RepID=A0A212QQ19_9PROT|nr:thioredoxin family protein [Arboricoccus pini]SNB61384.1 AhpC/TSA family protein [Arboricoccus pini]